LLAAVSSRFSKQEDLLRLSFRLISIPIIHDEVDILILKLLSSILLSVRCIGRRNASNIAPAKEQPALESWLLS
jgi:hypothetical protein